MIYSSSDKLKVGSVITPAAMTNQRGEDISPQPLYVVREVDRAAYILSVIETGGSVFSNQIQFPYYYEIATD